MTAHLGPLRVVCDGRPAGRPCPVVELGYEDTRHSWELRRWLAQVGWQRRGGDDLCPSCAAARPVSDRSFRRGTARALTAIALLWGMAAGLLWAGYRIDHPKGDPDHG